MNPSFRFNDVDVLANRNSLRKLLDFVAGRQQDSFRLNLFLEHRTLVIERCERNARQLIRGSQTAGWGRSFEGTFTKYPAGLEDSVAHHRALRYQLGELSCVVRFEVDACYGSPSEQGERSSQSLDLAMRNLAIGDGLAETPAAARPMDQRAPPMVQEMAAEIKTASKHKSLGQFLPQLWFGRTPWLIVGRHSEGTFQEVKITDAAAAFADWETRRQADLRRLVAILVRLRKAVEENGGEPCVALCEKATPPAIRVFPMEADRKAAPDHLRQRLWNAEEGGSPAAVGP